MLPRKYKSTYLELFYNSAYHLDKYSVCITEKCYIRTPNSIIYRTLQQSTEKSTDISEKVRRDLGFMGCDLTFPLRIAVRKIVRKVSRKHLFLHFIQQLVSSLFSTAQNQQRWKPKSIATM